MPNIGGPAIFHSLVSAKGYRVLFATTVDEFLRIANFPIGSIDAMVSGPAMAAIGGLHPTEEIGKLVR